MANDTLAELVEEEPTEEELVLAQRIMELARDPWYVPIITGLARQVPGFDRHSLAIIMAKENGIERLAEDRIYPFQSFPGEDILKDNPVSIYAPNVGNVLRKLRNCEGVILMRKYPDTFMLVQSGIQLPNAGVAELQEAYKTDDLRATLGIKQLANRTLALVKLSLNYPVSIFRLDGEAYILKNGKPYRLEEQSSSLDQLLASEAYLRSFLYNSSSPPAWHS